MPGQTRRTISEAHGDGVHSLQDELSFDEAHILRVLNEQDVDVLLRLLAGCGPGNDRACARSRCGGCGMDLEGAWYDDACNGATYQDVSIYFKWLPD